MDDASDSEQIFTCHVSMPEASPGALKQLVASNDLKIEWQSNAGLNGSGDLHVSLDHKISDKKLHIDCCQTMAVSLVPHRLTIVSYREMDSPTFDGIDASPSACILIGPAGPLLQPVSATRHASHSLRQLQVGSLPPPSPTANDDATLRSIEVGLGSALAALWGCVFLIGLVYLYMRRQKARHGAATTELESGPPEPLGPEWSEQKDAATGIKYYYNEKTEESSWVRPKTNAADH